jgi:hypothetical protein
LLTERVYRENGEGTYSEDSRPRRGGRARPSGAYPGGRREFPEEREARGPSLGEATDPEEYPAEALDDLDPYFRDYAEEPEEPPTRSRPKSGAESSLDMLDALLRSPAAEDPEEEGERLPTLLSHIKVSKLGDMRPEEFFLLVEKAVERGIRKALSKK